MISEAINTIIKDVCDFYPLYGDINREKNFGVYKINTTPIRTKDGLGGYKGTINIGVINEVMADCETQSKSVIALFEAIQNATYNGTEITHIKLISEDYDFDIDEKLFYSTLQFSYISKNE